MKVTQFCIISETSWLYVSSTYVVVAVSTAAMIQESLPTQWFHRESFSARGFLMFQWLLLACLLSMCYKSILLSTLIPIRYAEIPDTIDRVDRSELQMFIPKNTAPHKLVASDPRESVKRIFERAILFPFNGTTPQWVIDE